jgi:hypothetical protein
LIPNLSGRHNAEPVHSLEEIARLKELFPDNILQFNVYHNDAIVAGQPFLKVEPLRIVNIFLNLKQIRR